jgi:hypothetical protein
MFMGNINRPMIVYILLSLLFLYHLLEMSRLVQERSSTPNIGQHWKVQKDFGFGTSRLI